MLLCSVEQNPFGAGTSKYDTTQAYRKVALALTRFPRHHRGVGLYRLASSSSPKSKIERRGIGLSTCRALNDSGRLPRLLKLGREGGSKDAF
jgi:hypothetical protein